MTTHVPQSLLDAAASFQWEDVPPLGYLVSETAQYDNPEWLAEQLEVPVEDIISILEFSLFAAKGRRYRERIPGITNESDGPKSIAELTTNEQEEHGLTQDGRSITRSRRNESAPTQRAADVVQDGPDVPSFSEQTGGAV